MTDTDEILLDIRTTPDAELAAGIGRAMIESAAVIASIVRAQACALKAFAEERDEKNRRKNDTGARTRELVSLVLAASRTMEMKHRIDGAGGDPDGPTREQARKLLELTEAEIAEFLARRRAAAAERKDADRGLPGSRAVLLDGDRS